MSKLKQAIEWLLYISVFFLPLQTRWIYQQGILNGEKWEYGTFSIYATEMLLGVIFVLALIYCLGWIKKQEIPSRLGGHLCFLGNETSRVEADKKLKKQWRRLILLVLLSVLVSLSCLLAINKEVALYKSSYLIAAVALLFIIMAVKPSAQKIYWAIVLSGAAQSVLAIQQFINQKIVESKWLGMAEQNPETLGVPVVPVGEMRFLRAFGTLPHPNILAGFLVFGLILTIGLFALVQNQKQKKILSLLFVINSLGLMTALSRAAFLAMILGLVVFSFLARRDKVLSRATTRFALIFLFIAVIFFVSYPELILSRAVGDNRIESQSNSTRIIQYHEAGRTLKDNWLTGVGPGNYTVYLEKINPGQPAWSYQPIHNTYLLIFSELGVLGLAACLLFFIFIGINLFRSKDWPAERLAGLACFVCLAGLACFDHYFWSFYFGLTLMAVIIAVNGLSAAGRSVKTIVVSGPVIIENNKVLLIKDFKDDFWKFPGGRVNGAESEVAACRREAREELGIGLEILQKLKTLTIAKSGDPRIQVELIHYLARRKGDVRPGQEVKEWHWFGLNELPSDAAPNIAPIIDFVRKYGE